MSNIAFFNGFPGNWSYQGEALFIVGDFACTVSTSLKLIFSEETRVTVKILWNSISLEKRAEIELKLREFHYQKIVIQKQIILTGVTFSPLNSELTEFIVCRIKTLTCYPENTNLDDNLTYFVRLRAYLNDEYSLWDDRVYSEFSGIPQSSPKAPSEERRRREREKMVEDFANFYCALNSGYEIRCGRKYTLHQDHETFESKNIETLYKLTFIDIGISSSSKLIEAPISENSQQVNDLLKHLEEQINDACAFLSVVCDREILPIYYDYSLSSKKITISGKSIPIWSRRKISRISTRLGKFITKTNLFDNVSDFLECCPISKILSRGIQHLKLTTHEATVELRLLAACSALEYFYSYWFWEMNGLSKLIQAVESKNKLAKYSKIQTKHLEKLKHNKKGKTPNLSLVIRFFLHDLEVPWKKYIDDSKDPCFILIRNELLHGSFVSNETVLPEVEQEAKAVATEALFKILKQTSQSNFCESYDDLPIPEVGAKFHSISDNWIDIKNHLDDLN